MARISRKSNTAWDISITYASLSISQCYRRTKKRGKNDRSSSLEPEDLVSVPSICLAWWLFLWTTPFSWHRKALSKSVATILLKVNVIKLEIKRTTFSSSWRNQALRLVEYQKLYGNIPDKQYSKLKGKLSVLAVVCSVFLQLCTRHSCKENKTQWKEKSYHF